MKLINTPDGRFVGGNGSNIKATIVTADWLNAIQDEITNTILEAGFELSDEVTQLLAAIKLIGGADAGYAKQSDLEKIQTFLPGQLVISFTGEPLEGTFPCYGGTVLVENYPKYAAKVGKIYGGDGTNTVGLPNIPDGFALIAAGNLTNVGTTTSGENKSHIHSAWSLEAGAHNHSTGQRYYTGATSNPSPNNMGTGGTLIYTDTQGSHSHTIGIGDSGGANNLAAGMKVLICIAY